MREDSSLSYSHAEKTNVFIEEVCEESGLSLQDMDAIAVGSGPGSYTGLRIGTSIAKGLCFALNVPLIGIPSLHIIANGMRTVDTSGPDILVPMIDARRDEVFTTVLDKDLNTIQPTHPLVLNEEGYATLDHDIWAVGGDGSPKVDHPNARYVEGITTSVKWMAALAAERFRGGSFEDLAYYVPTYGKAAQPTKSKKAKQL